jgi:RNA polymerase primary sigma factor/RNA polymerase nonessential primary-like sigma factor
MSRITRAASAVDLTDEIRSLLDLTGRTLEDITVERDGELVISDTLVEDLRTLAEDLEADDDAPVVEEEVLAALEDDLAEESDVEVEAVDNRELEDFNFEHVVATLDLIDTEGSLAALEAERRPFERAARRAGKRNPGAEFYNVVNAPLFNTRKAMQAEVAELEAIPAAERTPQQAVALRRAQRSLEHLTELIVRFNYGMTRKYVKLFTSNTSREDSEDFQGAAVLGLMNSIDTFDPDKGRFGSWAYKRIQREVLRAVRDADFANMNHGDFERRPDIMKAYARLAGPEDNRRVPSYEEVAAAVGCTVELVTRVLSAPHLESLHTQVGDEGDTELGDLIPDRGESVDAQVLGAMDVEALMQYGMSALDTRENFVLVRRFGLDGEPPQCLSSIGKQLRLSREAVRQIESKALAKMLHPVTLRKLVRHGRA